jgi:hypothetical protein
VVNASVSVSYEIQYPSFTVGIRGQQQQNTYVLYQLFKTVLGMIALPPIIGDDALRMVEKHLEKPLGGTETCGDVAFVSAAAAGWCCCFNTSFWIVDRIMLGRKNNIF